MNTPKLGLRVCQDHEDTTARFSDHYQKQKQNNAAIADDKDEVDEESLNEDNETATTDEDGLNDNDSDPAQITTKKEKNGIYQGVIRICNTKETRTSTLYEVTIYHFVNSYFLDYEQLTLYSQQIIRMINKKAQFNLSSNLSNEFYHQRCFYSFLGFMAYWPKNLGTG